MAADGESTARCLRSLLGGLFVLAYGLSALWLWVGRAGGGGGPTACVRLVAPGGVGGRGGAKQGKGGPGRPARSYEFVGEGEGEGEHQPFSPAALPPLVPAATSGGPHAAGGARCAVVLDQRRSFPAETPATRATVGSAAPLLTVRRSRPSTCGNPCRAPVAPPSVRSACPPPSPHPTFTPTRPPPLRRCTSTSSLVPSVTGQHRWWVSCCYWWRRLSLRGPPAAAARGGTRTVVPTGGGGARGETPFEFGRRPRGRGTHLLLGKPWRLRTRPAQRKKEQPFPPPLQHPPPAPKTEGVERTDA